MVKSGDFRAEIPMLGVDLGRVMGCINGGTLTISGVSLLAYCFVVVRKGYNGHFENASIVKSIRFVKQPSLQQQFCPHCTPFYSIHKCPLTCTTHTQYIPFGIGIHMDMSGWRFCDNNDMQCLEPGPSGIIILTTASCCALHFSSQPLFSAGARNFSLQQGLLTYAKRKSMGKGCPKGWSCKHLICTWSDELHLFVSFEGPAKRTKKIPCRNPCRESCILNTYCIYTSILWQPHFFFRTC